MQGGAPGTSSVVAFLGKSLPFLSMPLVMFPTQFASSVKKQPQPGWKGRGHGGRVLKSPRSTFRDIQLRKALPGRGKCWFHRVFHEPLPGPVSVPAARLWAVCADSQNLLLISRTRKKRGRKSPTSWKHRDEYCTREHCRRCRRALVRQERS